MYAQPHEEMPTSIRLLAPAGLRSTAAAILVSTECTRTAGIGMYTTHVNSAPSWYASTLNFVFSTMITDRTNFGAGIHDFPTHEDVGGATGGPHTHAPCILARWVLCSHSEHGLALCSGGDKMTHSVRMRVCRE